ncbi:MAG: ammonia-forming cytochrome c nitrite reductase subunit c552 [Bacteroidetes bacterium]|nr:ammonia-forming cytochrome c nitrite reductase subunit c552 [Bacteroidota bacterium]MCW5894902.1 ammonia-forming cytochrome c nitrite reductase subunit c552 [Bacteroidota bacterium]
MNTRTKRWLTFGGSILVTILVAALLINIFERQQEGRLTYMRIVEIPPGEPDPDAWKVNFPREYEAYMRTVRTSEMDEYSKWGRYGGSEAFSKLEKHPDYRRLFAGYPFSVEYREERGHMNALKDMLASPRLGDEKPGTCMTCKSSQVPAFVEQYGAELFYKTPVKELVEKHGFKHSVVCADCHDSKTMELKVTRIAFKEAMQRRGIDISKASRQEMRSYVCGQCHVEYYFKGPGKYLTFPWDKGVVLDSIEAYYEKEGFSDWTHAESKAPMIKMQHPEFEIWSTGIHARSNVSCADCHMPYRREGAIKVTDHWIRSPLGNLTNACLTCHRQSETEMRERVLQIQDRTYGLMQRSEIAIIAAIDGIKAAMQAGATDEELKAARQLHRKSQMRWDFISAENSMGFHSSQEVARILGDAIDYARQSELEAYKVLATRGTRGQRVSYAAE